MFILAIFHISCEKEVDYPDIPEIKFRSFTLTESDDSFSAYIGTLSFDFVDGNGNIGIPPNDPSDTLANDTIEYDLFIQKYILQNGEFIEGSIGKYRLPYMEGGIYYEYIKGTMNIDIYYYSYVYDTLQYSFYIVDRDSNSSNIEFTDTIIFNSLIQP